MVCDESARIEPLITAVAACQTVQRTGLVVNRVPVDSAAMGEVCYREGRYSCGRMQQTQPEILGLCIHAEEKEMFSAGLLKLLESLDHQPAQPLQRHHVLLFGNDPDLSMRAHGFVHRLNIRQLRHDGVPLQVIQGIFVFRPPRDIHEQGRAALSPTP